MSKLTSPSITIAFAERGATAITRGERGIVALILKGARQQTFKVISISDIPTGVLSEENEQYIKDVLVGYSYSPKYILVYVMPTAEDMSKAYKDMMQYFDKSIPRNELLDEIWGINAEIETRVVDETVYRIRQKLRTAKSKVGLLAIWGFGYKLEIKH